MIRTVLVEDGTVTRDAVHICVDAYYYLSTVGEVE